VLSPIIETDRLTLRPFRLSDASDVQRLAGEREIADTTMTIPHPYEDGMVEEWIAGEEVACNAGKSMTLAIVLRGDAPLVGAIGLKIERDHDKAELGYWIGKPFWNCGYATEAGRALLGYGFGELQLNRIHAAHMGSNPSSGRVMEKLGMLYEGTARQELKKSGRLEDLVSYAILREDWSDAIFRHN
jgi:RimJ/RimL family protein N-acetyltransferase